MPYSMNFTKARLVHEGVILEGETKEEQEKPGVSAGGTLVAAYATCAPDVRRLNDAVWTEITDPTAVPWYVTCPSDYDYKQGAQLICIGVFLERISDERVKPTVWSNIWALRSDEALRVGDQSIPNRELS